MRDEPVMTQFQEMKQAKEEKRPFVFCTVLFKEGSGPRGAGAHMLVRAGQETTGTLGGGRAEYLAEEKAKELLAAPDPAAFLLLSFALGTGGEQGDTKTGMICGGRITVAFLRDGLFSDETLGKLTAFRAGRDEGYLVLEREDGKHPAQVHAYLRQEAPAGILRHAGRTPFFTQSPDGTLLYTEQVTSGGRVIVAGAGHVARALVPVLSLLGFPVTVVDEREDLASGEFFPTAQEVSCLPYDTLKEILPISERDFLIVMTKGHAGDTAVLEQYLTAHPAFIGCIGSRTKAQAVRERLLAAGFPQEDVDRIESPVGLPIGAKTPEEIAISIAAELVRVRAGMEPIGGNLR